MRFTCKDEASAEAYDHLVAETIEAIKANEECRLRLVLSGAYALRAMLDGRRVPAISTLRTKARKAWELTHAGRYTGLTDLLRSLVPDLETAARSVPQEQRVDVSEPLADRIAEIDSIADPGRLAALSLRFGD